MGVDYDDAQTAFYCDTLVLDVSYIAFRHYHAMQNRVVDSEGTPTGHILGAFTNLKLLNYDLKPRRVVYCYDRGHKWRNALVPEYKSNRRPLIQNDDAWSPVTGVEQLYRTFPGHHLSYEDAEADDMAAWCAANHNREGSMVIYSADKDLYQLVDDATGVMCAFPKKPGKGKRTKTFFVHDEQVHEDFGVKPIDIPKYKALFGDKSDMIDGVKGGSRPGKKKALSRFVKGDESDLFFDLGAEPDLGSLPDWLQMPMFEQRERLAANLKIINLKAAAARIDLDFDSCFTKGNMEQTFEVLLEFECESLLSQVPFLHNAMRSSQSID